jgi:hypothetical protein
MIRILECLVFVGLCVLAQYPPVAVKRATKDLHPILPPTVDTHEPTDVGACPSRLPVHVLPHWARYENDFGGCETEVTGEFNHLARV